MEIQVAVNILLGISLGVIMVIVAAVLHMAWNTFFQWYARKREREAKIFKDSLNNRTFEMRTP